MAEIFEIIMLICFGISWPISVYKSATSHSTKGKSVFFTIAIIFGYVAGIFSKLLAGKLNYVLGLYILNLIIVFIDLILYFINRSKEKKEENKYDKRNFKNA